VAEIVAQVQSSDAIELSAQEARDFAAAAKMHIALLPAGTYRQAFEQLADFVVARRL
jgi:geranylgeranyl pyrophosphate synthase